jgi:hypothetical protein
MFGLPYNFYGVGVLLISFPRIGLLWWMDLGSKSKSKNPWPIWIITLDMSTKCQGEPMQISWNLCMIQTKFIKIKIQEDFMCFKSSFFP